MKKYAVSLILLVIATSAALAQTPDAAKANGKSATESSTIPAPSAITASRTPLELARAALAAPRGDKLKIFKSTRMMASANLCDPNQSQPLPGCYAIVTVGD